MDRSPPLLPAGLPKSLGPARKAYIDGAARAAAEIAPKQKTVNADYLRALASLQPKAAGNAELTRQIAAEKENLLKNVNAGGVDAAGLVGTWLAENLTAGNNDQKTINADGTFNKGETRLGKWEIKKRQLVFHYEGGGTDAYDLPIRDNKLTGRNNLGQTVTLKKESK